MTKLPEDKINHEGINYIAIPDPKNYQPNRGKICKDLCDLRELQNLPLCRSLNCAEVHWKKEKIKSSSTPKYKIKDRGFTLEEWLEAESCRDSHFRSDFQMLLNEYDDVFKPIKEVPKHIFECPTMKEKFIEFGFVVEVKEEKFYSIGDRFNLKHAISTTPDTYVLVLKPNNGISNTVFLTNINKGTYWNYDVKVDDPNRITQAEMDLIHPNMIKIN